MTESLEYAAAVADALYADHVWFDGETDYTIRIDPWWLETSARREMLWQWIAHLLP